METAHRLPRFFVLWWVLAGLTAGLLVPVLSGLLGARPGRTLIEVVWAGALGVVVTLCVASVRLALESVLIARARVGMTARGWFLLGLLGTFSGLVVATPLRLLITGLLSLSGVHHFALLVVAPGVVSGVVGGSLIGVVQMTAFSGAGYTRAADWVWARMGAAVLGAVPMAVFGAVVSPAAHPAWLGMVSLSNPIITGVVMAFAFQRIVEAQPAPPAQPEDVGAIPEVPSGAPPVQ